ncbi:Carboxypeptidase A4, partial [Chytridiales sp. JEL 0842]
IVRFHADTPAQVELLKQHVADSSLGLDTWTGVHPGQVDVRVPKEVASVIEKTLFKEIKHEVLMPNLQEIIDNERRHMEANSFVLESQLKAGITSNLTAATIFADYQSLESLNAFLTSLPGVTPVSFGTTYLGANIPGVKFGSGSKNVVFHGGIHAREWISPATVTYVTNFLATDPAAESLRNTFTFHVAPVLNPDGYAHTRAARGDRMWRKNRAPNKGSSCIGVDPNRNFDSAWSKPGASSNPCADDYYGPAPFASQEAKGVADYITSLTNVVSYIDFHSYSQLWMFPNGYSCSAKAKDYNALFAGGKAAVDALRT